MKQEFLEGSVWQLTEGVFFVLHSAGDLPVDTEQTHNKLWQVDKKWDFPVS